MEITVSDYRGCSSAKLSLDRILLCAGKNQQGKSSLAEAVGAALTGHLLPDGVQKKDAKLLVADSRKSAAVAIRSEGGVSRATWPDCDYKQEGGRPPQASLFAVGIEAIAKMDEKKRAAALAPYLRSEPTKADLQAAMAEKFSTVAIDRLWAEIERVGWDKAHADQELIRRDASRDWSKLTGESWGHDKASRWRPAEWESLFEPTGNDWTAVIEEAKNQVAEAKGRVENRVAEAAVDQAELDRLRNLAAAAEARRIAESEAETALAVAAEEVAKAEAAAAALLPPIETGLIQKCPECGAALTLQASEIVLAASISETENKKRRLDKAGSDGELSRLRPQKANAERALESAQAAVHEAEQAQKQISNLGEKRGAASELKRSRDELFAREQELAMVNKAAEAFALYRQWAAAQAKVEILAPAGLRARKLGEAVDVFNSAILAPLCETAGWSLVNLTRDLAIRLGERPYALNSDSGRLRVDYILQIAQARLDGSQMVILDRADMLDSPGRNGLFRLLRGVDIPSIICMTLSKPEDVPNLDRTGIGKSYWVEGGVVRALYEPQKEAAQ